MLRQEPTANPEAVTLELERILASPIFTKAHRSERLLRYLVAAALADPPIPVKEYTIAIDVFDRDPSYDPSVDATVRVEASRLRTRLREFYTEQGREDPVFIEVPKGGYAALLQTRSPSQANLPRPGALHLASPEPAGHNAPAVRSPVVSGRALHLRRPLLAGLLLLAGIAVFWGWRTHARSAVVAPSSTSLAILPIVNRTGDPTLDTLCDGLTDDLIRQLSQVPALKLIGRTSVFRYRQRTADARTIGRSLGVNSVMVGELRRTPDHLALTAELSNTRDGSVLLDREYIAEGSDLRSVQADLQQDVVAALHVESSARDPGRTLRSVASNPQAYQEFLQGDALARNVGPADVHQAIAHFEKAVALDPGFDLGWSALASEHLLLGLYFEAPRDHMPLARSFAQRALQINPSLGEAHGSLGLIHLVYDWDLPAAQAEMKTAGAEQAAISTLACTAHLIERTGRPRTAEEMLGRLLTYDPQSVSLIAELGCVDYYRGDYEAALRHYREALQSDPESPVPYWGLGKTLNAQGRHAEAIAALRSFKRRSGFEPPLITAEIGCALGASRHPRQALAVVHGLAATAQHTFVDPYLVSLIFASMNDRDATFKWLNKALEARSTFMISLPTEPRWEPFRADPRFQQIVQRMLQGRPA